MTKLKKKVTQKGDTLIEVVFALLIIGVIVAVALQGAIRAHRSAVAARQRTEANLVAQFQAEMFRAYRNYLGHWDSSVGSPSLIEGLNGIGVMDNTDNTANCNTESADLSKSFFTYLNYDISVEPQVSKYDIKPGALNRDTANPGTDGDMTSLLFNIMNAGISNYNVEIRIQCAEFNSNRDLIHYITRVTWTDTQNQTATIAQDNYIARSSPDY